MIHLRNILLFLFLLATPVAAPAASSSGSGGFNATKVIFDHLKDSYEWHITTIGDKHITIDLPVILYSDRVGWQLFSSGVFHHSPEYNGFHIATGGAYEGKITEYDEQGNEQRPVLDISITKNVLAVFVNALLLVIIVLCVSRWYKKHTLDDGAPKGFVGAMEAVVCMIIDDVIKPNIGDQSARFTPYLLTVFFYILLSNLMGLVPIFPGGANVTGNIAVTLALALCTFVAVNVFGNREYWKEILWPDVPMWLKVPMPLMPFIEIFGLFVKPFALTVRLFANIFAGHTALLVFVCLIFITVGVNKYLGGAMSVISVFFSVFMNILELLVAFIQAFVFTMLSAVFIGLAQPSHHHKEEEK
jgi:F-type H+-transporting ATPase subunit a